jgi:hypothetical protein
MNHKPDSINHAAGILLYVKEGQTLIKANFIPSVSAHE